jgi:hypothetical protein
MSGQRIAQFAAALCGAVLVYMALGALAGLAFPDARPLQNGCQPETWLHTLTGCHKPTIYAIWRWTVGIPRFLVSWPLVAVGLVQSLTANMGSSADLAAFAQTFAAVFVAVMAAATWFGFRFWQPRVPAFAWLLLIVLAGHNALYVSAMLNNVWPFRLVDF